jgi:hypothetical protein
VSALDDAVSCPEEISQTGSSARLGGARMLALGMLALQLTWMFALPPFAGIDEFDHVYRAAAVARGDWFAEPAAATRGTGAWLDVPSDIVKAARPQCEILGYTKASDCIGTPHGRTTHVASGAGRYHPLFYAFVGTPALLFHGHAALYAMRGATVLLSWMLFYLAVTSVRRWARTPWPMATMAIACTPVLLYSCAIVAPNGVEMMAGMALWATTLGLTRARSRRDQDALMIGMAISGSMLATTRSLGPLWCLMILATVLAVSPPSCSLVASLVRRRKFWLSASAIAVSGVLSTAWIVGMGALNIGQKLEKPMSWGTRLDYLVHEIPLWMLQSIAAFPLRNEQTRTPVYVCFLLLFLGLTVLGWQASRGRLRLSIIGAIVTVNAVPFIMGLNQDADPGAWQGRYALPYAFGIALMIGAAIDDSESIRMTSRLRVAVLVFFLVGQVIGPVDVLRRTTHHHLADWATFPHPSVPLLAVTASLGSALLWWGASSDRKERTAWRQST